MRIWYRCRDAQELLPPRAQVDFPLKETVGVFNLKISTSYFKMGGYDIRLGPLAFRKCYMSLLNVAQLVEEGRYVEVLKSGPLSVAASGIAEAIRFILYRAWVLSRMNAPCLPGSLEMLIPNEYGKHFNWWGKYSKAMRTTEFPPGRPPVREMEEIKERLAVVKSKLIES
ncbi:hypothetical protein ACP4OV_018240 [Aristida adscensionis]